MLILPALAVEGKTLDDVAHRDYLDVGYMRGNGGIFDRGMYEILGQYIVYHKISSSFKKMFSFLI